MSSCPQCGKPVDPLRSRFVAVKAGKVVAYCSKECLAAQETSVPRKLPTLESGPVIEIIHEPATGVVTSAPDRRDPDVKPTGAKSASTSGKAGKKKRTEPAIPVPAAPVVVEKPVVEEDDPQAEWKKNAAVIKAAQEAEAPAKKSKAPLAIAAAIVLAGGGVAAYKLTQKHDKPAPPPPPPHTEVAPPVKPAPPPEPPKPVVDIPAALDKAKAALAKYLRSDNPRLQRAAAGALERGVDRASAELLNAALANEKSDLPRLEIAYMLARGNDARGMSALMQAINSTPPEPRRWAAERVVRLALADQSKPDAAVAVLVPELDKPANKLADAELLAQLGPRANDASLKAQKVLHAIREDAAAAADVRARATIALVRAGVKDLAPEATKLLDSGNDRGAAAAALAHIHDASVKPVLIEQLGVVGQRVRAARALRELEPNLDAGPLLPPLLAGLETLKDNELIEAGEAILVLAGPAAWGARD